MHTIEKYLKEHGNKVRGLAYSVCRNAEDADEIVQNVFMKLHRQIAKEPPKYVRSWLYRVTYREAVDVIRSRSRKPSIALMDDPGGEDHAPHYLYVDTSHGPGDLVIGAELQEQIECVMYNLPFKQRLALQLHSVNGLSLKETATIMDQSIGAVKTQVHRAFKAVQDILKQDAQCALETKCKSKACPLLVKFVLSYARDDLDIKVRNEFEEYIADSEESKTFLSTYLQAIAITGSIKCDDLPLVLVAKLRSFLEA